MGRSFYIITALLGFLAGVGFYLVSHPSLLFLTLYLIAVFLLFFVFRKKRVALIFLFLLSFSLGLLRAGLSEHRVTPEVVDFYNGQKAEITGVITEADIRRDKAKYKINTEVLILNDQLLISNDQIISKSEFLNKSQIEGDILISLDKYPQYHYGERVRLFGELAEPGEFDGFNYGNYLSRYGVYSVMYYPKIDVLEEGQGNLFWHGMVFLQNKFMDKINRLFPEPHASFEAGLLVGARKGIPDALMEKFNITGLTHIIAISGYNITIIIVFVMWLLKGIPRRVGFIVAITAIILFTLFVGASPAVVRASIMGVLGLLALNYGRQSNIHLTILWTAFFMVAWNPKILWWDVGFQLSFAAVLGLIYVAPLFERYSKKLPEAFGIREAIMMTLSAQVMALPIIIFNFERLSMIAPLANLLVAFALPPAMLFGFIAVIVSFLSHTLALIPAYITWGILSYIIKTIELTAAVPYASVDLPGMKLWMMFGYYILLVVGLVIYSYRIRD